MQTRLPTIQWQIMVRQLPLLILLFVCVLFWLGEYLKGILLSANLENAKRSNLVVVHAIQSSMMAERDHRVWDRVVEKIPRHEGTEIEIVDMHGAVIFSTDATRRGIVQSLGDPLCAQCHDGGSRQATAETTVIRDPGDESYQIFVSPLPNSEDCLTCHSDDGQKLGMVLVRQSLDPIHRQIRTVQIALTFAGVIALLLTILTTRLLLSRYLGRPLKILVASARALGAGDLEVTVELPERNELNILANTLNASGARLARMVRRLEQQRDDSQTLYRLVDQLSRGILPEERSRRAVELAGKILEADCLLVRAAFRPEERASDGLLTFRDGDKIVEHPLSDGVETMTVPSFYSVEIVQQWLQGAHDDKTEVREGMTVAYPLRRSGQRLGLLLRPARPYDNHPSTSGVGPDPEMVQALTKHLAIALEFSDLQRQLVEEERLAAIGETAAGLAHWLKNTLNGLRAGQYVIDRAIELNDTAKFHKGWHVMKKSTRQVEKLTSDLLYCAKERVPKREPTDPNEVIRGVVDLLSERAMEQGVRLAVDLDDGIEQEALEHDSIHRVLLNLVTNAIDACTESESGDLVTVKSQATPGEIVLTVQDNGIGMSDAVQRNLFTRFFSTKGSKGTGLGLMVVKKIIEEHGGALEVESKYGRGSAFHIRLPRKNQGRETAPVP